MAASRRASNSLRAASPEDPVPRVTQHKDPAAEQPGSFSFYFPSLFKEGVRGRSKRACVFAEYRTVDRVNCDDKLRQICEPRPELFGKLL